ncbi:MAG: RdgB/HAM1 family non-canonical purine NTP pyrophosphatase [Bdellovibrionales bacterium]|nr:RdgB/HAM1 family non-canonical purine NTP pyrophosphatase [Bdellovibrionales bacterium]
MNNLLIGTTNRGKINEIKSIFQDQLPHIRLRLLDEFKPLPIVHETGGSFQANARLKARAYAALTGLITLADDSGLEIDCLKGKPGVFSARFAGNQATDQDNIKKTLQLLTNIPIEKRKARYVCDMILYISKDTLLHGHGVLEGHIHTRADGDQGFGYDPIFFIPEKQKTVAMLSTEEKNKISHRQKALQSLIEQIRKLESIER